MSANAEAIEAWDGPLFERFAEYRHIVTTGLAEHGEAALERYPPRLGDRVLDIGCGFGDTTQALGALVGPRGEAVGVDAAPRFIAAAREETVEPNVRFEVADVQHADLPGRYDHAFSRMGTMFFANPVVALRHVRRALRPGGRLVMVVWRRREDNDWLYAAQRIVEDLVGRPDRYEEPTCGPGPFSMAGADTVTDILLGAGFRDVALHRHDAPILIGRGLDEALDFVMALGPAGELVRLWGDRIAHRHQEIRDALRAGLAPFAAGSDGVRAPASTWTVSAVVPAS